MEPAPQLSPGPRRRGLSSSGARAVRQQGHDDALAFALLLGLDTDYRNDPKAKKDVIDPAGDAHSLKSGAVKWQIFLYGLNRFTTDDAFAVMNGLGEHLRNCINAFPERYEDYVADKQVAKDALRPHMRAIAERLQSLPRLRAFFMKSLFNGGEVNYLTVKHDGHYHVFLNTDVIDAFGRELSVENSQARAPGQTPEQKVVFKYDGANLAELEMRNDSPVHYREIRFNMLKARAMALLFAEIPQTATYGADILVYGNARKRFGRW